jgi:hypothetical protein
MFKTLATVWIIVFCDFITWFKCATAHVLMWFCHLNNSLAWKAKEGRHIRILNIFEKSKWSNFYVNIYRALHAIVSIAFWNCFDDMMFCFSLYQYLRIIQWKNINYTAERDNKDRFNFFLFLFWNMCMKSASYEYGNNLVPIKMANMLSIKNPTISDYACFRQPAI